MVMIPIVTSLVVSLAIIALAARWLQSQFPTVARAALKEISEDFLTLARGQFNVDREKGVGELEHRRQAIDQMLKGLEAQLQRYEQLVKGFESDRDQKYGQLHAELQQVAKETGQLHQATSNLIAVLGNSRVRGQWGQRMARDILQFCGLQENLQYCCETATEAGRPDYTFFLPDQHRLFMDVKFPLDHYLKYAASTRDEEQRTHQEAFIRDVREHLREMERRNYAQVDGSVDYIIIFIPNEQVYGLVNEWMPYLIDECLQKKTILCGPWSLYAVVRIIAQAWQHYHYTVAIRDIVRSINGFLQDYRLFRDRFTEVGALIEKLDKKYQEVCVTSHQRLENRIRRIEEYRKGQQIPEEPTGLWSSTDNPVERNPERGPTDKAVARAEGLGAESPALPTAAGS